MGRRLAQDTFHFFAITNKTKRVLRVENYSLLGNLGVTVLMPEFFSH